MTISVIVPVLNEADGIEATLLSAGDPAVVEVLVVDGGSTDDTVSRAARVADRVLVSPRGRALQMNVGARHARGDVLLFLHGDTLLPRDFGHDVLGAVAAGTLGGRFDVRLRGRSRLLPVVAALMNARSRWTRISTGDQAMFVRRDVFARLGGFAEIPLMEDVELSVRLRRAGRVAALRRRVVSSGRRWDDNGAVRTVLLMWGLRIAYACGVSPERLATRYRPARD